MSKTKPLQQILYEDCAEAVGEQVEELKYHDPDVEKMSDCKEANDPDLPLAKADYLCCHCGFEIGGNEYIISTDSPFFSKHPVKNSFVHASCENPSLRESGWKFEIMVHKLITDNLDIGAWFCQGLVVDSELVTYRDGWKPPINNNQQQKGTTNVLQQSIFQRDSIPRVNFKN